VSYSSAKLVIAKKQSSENYQILKTRQSHISDITKLKVNKRRILIGVVHVLPKSNYDPPKLGSPLRKSESEQDAVECRRSFTENKMSASVYLGDGVGKKFAARTWAVVSPT